jgi:5-methylcytosine-specific restriction protein A
MRPGRDVDHINGRHNHDITNLQLLCVEDHKEKTQREAQAGRASARAKARRPPIKHPGLM